MATFVAAAAAIAVASTSAIAYAASWPTSWHTPVEFAVYFPHFPHIHTYCILYYESIGTKIMQKCGMFVFFSFDFAPTISFACVTQSPVLLQRTSPENGTTIICPSHLPRHSFAPNHRMICISNPLTYKINNLFMNACCMMVRLCANKHSACGYLCVYSSHFIFFIPRQSSFCSWAVDGLNVGIWDARSSGTCMTKCAVFWEYKKKKRKMYDNRAIEEWVKGKIEVAEK